MLSWASNQTTWNVSLRGASFWHESKELYRQNNAPLPMEVLYCHIPKEDKRQKRIDATLDLIKRKQLTIPKKPLDLHPYCTSE